MVGLVVVTGGTNLVVETGGKYETDCVVLKG